MYSCNDVWVQRDCPPKARSAGKSLPSVDPANAAAHLARVVADCFDGGEQRAHGDVRHVRVLLLVDGEARLHKQRLHVRAHLHLLQPPRTQAVRQRVHRPRVALCSAHRHPQTPPVAQRRHASHTQRTPRRRTCRLAAAAEVALVGERDELFEVRERRVRYLEEARHHLLPHRRAHLRAAARDEALHGGDAHAREAVVRAQHKRLDLDQHLHTRHAPLSTGASLSTSSSRCGDAQGGAPWGAACGRGGKT